jgi:hypothetical protein
MARRKSVVTSSIAGNDENIRGRSMYKDVNNMIKEIVIFSAIQTSSNTVGIGKIRIANIPTNATGMRK